MMPPTVPSQAGLVFVKDVRPGDVIDSDNCVRARLTAHTLSCAAEAHVPKSRGATAAAFAPRQRRESDVGRRAAGHI
jgi:hypothetical protein